MEANPSNDRDRAPAFINHTLLINESTHEVNTLLCIVSAPNLSHSSHYLLHG